MRVSGKAALSRGTYSFVLAVVALAAGLAFTSQPVRADYTDGVIATDRISQEAAIRIWRKAAWQDDDFLSQIKLGDIYGDETGDNKYFDPIESYVWYYLAMKSDRADAHVDDWRARRVTANDIHRAQQRQYDLLLLLNAEQRTEARNRIVYILACRGADGFLKLGQIHSTLNTDQGSGPGYGPGPGENDVQSESPETENELARMWNSLFQVRHAGHRHAVAAERAEEEMARARAMLGILTSSVILPNDGEALTYYHIADNMGHPLAHDYVRTLEGVVRRQQGLGPRIISVATAKAKTWFPAYEYYPPGNTTSGIPYTDECYVNIDKQRALLLVASIPREAAIHALKFLGWGTAVSRYQASLLDQPTGRLGAGEMVRLMQTAAIRGDAASQNTLGVMYAKGIGVLRNYVRAEYWFTKAADQRYAAALYHLGVLYKVGPEGIQQDLSKSNDYMTQSAIAGFRPTMNQLQDLLSHAENAPKRHGQH